ncbi:hypothetical protein [Clostridium sp. DL1XJH146]
MKKFTVLILIVSIMCIFILTACGGETDTNNTQQANNNQEETTTEEANQEAASNDDDDSVLENLRKVKELEGKNLILVDVYNEVANMAIENGWDSDELTVKELNASDTIIQLFNSVITDPKNVTSEELDDLLLTADEITSELDTNTRAKVSVPYNDGQ